MERSLVIKRSWRSQWRRLLIYFALCAAAIFLSAYFPKSIIQGRLFTIGGQDIILVLPLFALMPLYGLLNLLYPVFDATLTLDNRGIETRIGIISLKQDTTRIRYEDIRSIDKMQTLVERILNVGTISIGTAATAGVEILFDGVAQPLDVINLVQQERDRRLRRDTGNDSTAEKVAMGQD
jgi:uncharacterized membrane protein YdbT with pleckstrin-like domain